VGTVFTQNAPSHEKQNVFNICYLFKTEAAEKLNVRTGMHTHRTGEMDEGEWDLGRVWVLWLCCLARVFYTVWEKVSSMKNNREWLLVLNFTQVGHVGK